MAGPAQTQDIQLIVPPGEAQVLYSAATLAQKIQNLELTQDGTLRSVIGPAVYEPYRGVPVEIFGDMRGIFHAGLEAGIADTLLVRAGTKLYLHKGAIRGWVEIATGLSNDHRALYPDQFLVLNNKIIYTNGIDGALVINHEGYAFPLGFRNVPGVPFSEGPRPTPPDQRRSHYSNDFGYSWPGKIGTVGDILDGQTGALLSGGWYYYVQWEDVFGNLSQPSAPSNLVKVSTLQSDPFSSGDDTTDPAVVTGSELDDLTRQFFVRIEGDGPEHCVAIRLYRTPDVKHVSTIPQLLVRIPNNRQITYPDNIPDSGLGIPMPEIIAVPVFRVMCTHQGRLVIGNVAGDPGVVRRSFVGLPGTFAAQDAVYPDSGGSEITGLASHAGKLLAFTENSVYELVDFSVPVPLAQGIGCVAPRSIKALPSGKLMWLARDGFYTMAPSGQVELVSNPINKTIRNFINKSRLRSAVSVIDPESLEYRCVVCEAGQSSQKLILTYDGRHWKRQLLGIHIADVCQTEDYRQYVLAVGRDSSAERKNEVFVMGRETSAYEPPERQIVYRSGWLRGDKTGLTPIHIRTMYIGLRDAWNGDFSIRFYRNGSWSEVVSMSDVRAIGPDDGSSIVTDIAGNAIIGTAKTRDPRLFFRQIPVGLETTSTWAFEISATSPTRLEIASFVFDITTASQGNPRSRTPFRSDI
tara:strand:- start:931 stop:3006 length:2076 start_codon:yes stop_codon:yes gene_type:complete